MSYETPIKRLPSHPTITPLPRVLHPDIVAMSKFLENVKQIKRRAMSPRHENWSCPHCTITLQGVDIGSLIEEHKREEGHAS